MASFGKALRSLAQRKPDFAIFITGENKTPEYEEDDDDMMMKPIPKEGDRLKFMKAMKKKYS